jgi:N utilization substance protein A
VIIREQEHAMEVVVPDDQLSLAIGRRGQNVRLAAQLTGWNIDVFSETRIEEMASRARRALTKVLGVDDSTAIILYSHSFRSFEDIANAELADFQQVPGVGQERLNEIYNIARKAVEEGVSTDSLIAEMVAEEEQRLKAEAEAKKAQEEAKVEEEPSVEEETKPEA